MGHGHRRSALSDESMSAFPDYAFADTEAQAAEERDAIEFLIDDYGNAVWMDERPRRIKIPEQAEPVLEHPIGYVEAPTDFEPDPRMMVDGEHDPTANEVTASTLQRGTRTGETYTRKDGSVGKKGGGGSSGGRIAKPPKPGKGQRHSPFTSGRTAEEDDVEEISVYGLSIGEVEFFHGQPGKAREVLIDTARAIERGERTLCIDVSDRIRRSKNAKPNFCVYGLSALHVFMLRTAPGTARAALSEYARAMDGERIRWREADEAVA